MNRFFIITIDTEGDNLWAKTRNPGTRNVHYIPRFQALCDSYGYRPVYLVDYQMATCAPLCELLNDALRRNTCEVGMHLHAWSTPPLTKEKGLESVVHPYLINSTDQVIREKVQVMTDLLGETFGQQPVSHRAGRWAIDARYVQVLIKAGYKVDCSVTPKVNWPKQPSSDGTWRGADYRCFPEPAYFVNEQAIDQPGHSSLLEVPMTIAFKWQRWDDYVRPLLSPLSGAFPALGRRTVWLRPTGRNLPEMLKMLDDSASQGDYAEFMLHSSEFMPGGSPTFADDAAIERLYQDLQALFAHAVRSGFAAATLKEFYQYKLSPRQVPS